MVGEEEAFWAGALVKLLLLELDGDMVGEEEALWTGALVKLLLLGVVGFGASVTVIFVGFGT